MRTTVNVDEDVAAEIARLRREQGIGLSAALNLLARRGLAAGAAPRTRFRQESADLDARVDVTNIGEVLDLLDEPGG
jgi:hypothetical protein